MILKNVQYFQKIMICFKKWSIFYMLFTLLKKLDYINFSNNIRICAHFQKVFFSNNVRNLEKVPIFHKKCSLFGNKMLTIYTNCSHFPKRLSFKKMWKYSCFPRNLPKFLIFSFFWEKGRKIDSTVAKPLLP